MLVADGGGGYGGTNWTGYDVPRMWSLLEGQQTDPHWKLVAGWRKTYELTSMHLSRLKTYRTELAEAWPPERNAASARYVAELDYLINHVQETYDAAVANYQAFSGATGAISGTRHELKKIADEYLANQTKLDAWERQVAAANKPAESPYPAVRPTPSPSPSPSPYPKTPPVPNGRQEQLTYQARSLMYKLSGELIQARTALRQPPPYEPPRGRRNPEKEVYDPTGGNTVALPPPPVIPPIVTTPAPPPPHTPTPPASTVTPVQSGPIGMHPGVGAGGPILGGTNGPLPGTIPPMQTHFPTVPPPPPTTGIIGPTPPPIVPPLAKPTTGLIGTPPSAMKPMAGSAMPLPKGMPPGGVIGPVGQPAATHPTSAMRSVPQRVNPVGGVIGGTPTTPGARPMAAGTTPMAGVPGRGQGRNSDEQGRHWDPDNPWETDEGVAPVLEAPNPVFPIEPGPAIGYHR